MTIKRQMSSVSRVMYYKIKNASFATKIVLLISFLTSFLLMCKLLEYVVITNLESKTEKEKCPACYGNRICRRIGEASVFGWDKLQLVSSVFNVKNVFMGRIGSTELVFKKLGHKDELDHVDAMICQGKLTRGCSTNNPLSCVQATPPPSCNMHGWLSQITSDMKGPLSVKDVKGLSDMTYCPSPELVRRISHRYLERGDFVHADGLSPIEKTSLLYTLAVNQEPILLQVFPAGEGWPFPAYIGACGRLIAVENAGRPLREFFNDSWLKRLDLSLQLLRIADHLTDNAAGFKLYFTDISLDNYVVDANDKVTIADAENIYVVDEKHVSETQPVGWSDPHISAFDECPESTNCLSIDTDKLCSKAQSDFNYYAVCRGLLSSYAADEDGLSGGLLHSMPDALPNRAELIRLADECAKPRGISRFTVKDQLMSLIEGILKNAAS